MADNDKDIEKHQLSFIEIFNLICELREHSDEHSNYQIEPSGFIVKERSMVKEIAVIRIDPAEAGNFIRTYHAVAPILRRQPGFVSDELLSVVEDEREYILIVQWERVEDHSNFVKSADFKLLADPWGPMQKEVTVRHAEIV